MDPNPPLTELASEIPVPTTSLVARMRNVLATPGEVFDEVKQSQPSTANWLVPTLLAVVTGIVFVFVVFAQPAIIQQIREQTTKALEAQVKAGKLTQPQVDQYVDLAVNVGKLSGAIGAALFAFARVFWWTLIIWLMGRWFFHAGFSYVMALEVTGLATVISILGGIIATLLEVYLGRITNVSLALFIPHAPPNGLLLAGLRLVDFFDLWFTCVMAVGLARLAGVSWSRALVPVFCYWLIMAAVLFSFAVLGAHMSALAKQS